MIKLLNLLVSFDFIWSSINLGVFTVLTVVLGLSMYIIYFPPMNCFHRWSLIFYRFNESSQFFSRINVEYLLLLDLFTNAFSIDMNRRCHLNTHFLDGLLEFALIIKIITGTEKKNIQVDINTYMFLGNWREIVGRKPRT